MLNRRSFMKHIAAAVLTVSAEVYVPLSTFDFTKIQKAVCLEEMVPSLLAQGLRALQESAQMPLFVNRRFDVQST